MVGSVAEDALAPTLVHSSGTVLIHLQFVKIRKMTWPSQVLNELFLTSM